MLAAIEQLRTNLGRARNLGALSKAVGAQTTQALDLSDLLRAELVSAVSAFDQFIHEVVRLGMLEIQRGVRTPTHSFSQFAVSMDSLREALSNPSSTAWLDAEIRNHHSWKSFQQSEKVADALRLVSDVKLWEEVARRTGRQVHEVKQQLDLIVDRRNKIAHESDTDPSFPGRRWPINESMVDDAVGFIDLLAETIYSLLCPR